MVRNNFSYKGEIEMVTAKVTSKGQITIPKEIREKLGIGPGEEICFEEKEGTIFIKKEVKESPFNEWMGYLKRKKGRSPDEIVEELRGR
ncbi:MAG: AbrB/MazE/SpoVT family DNA-binding domain-containing protein [Thermodesulfovibrionales bacterium]|nr:AbrB/MazE/SpoVT family DNA-binding domain-containing protein [Thermodesulfovibrionales bacterium]